MWGPQIEIFALKSLSVSLLLWAGLPLIWSAHSKRKLRRLRAASAPLKGSVGRAKNRRANVPGYFYSQR